MSKFNNQKGIVHILFLLILLVGLIGGVYLVTKGDPLRFFSKATNPPIVFKKTDGSALPTNANGVPQTTSSTIKVELTSTLGTPVFATPTPTPSPVPSPTPTSPVGSCNFGMYIKFQDITSNGPDQKFVSLSLRQPGTSTQLWKFDSVPASSKDIYPFSYTKGDLYRIGIGNVACGTFDVYVNSSGYQEKKFPNIVVDSNLLNDPETYIFNGPLVPVSPAPSSGPKPDLIVNNFNTVGTSLSTGTSPYFDVQMKNQGQAIASAPGGILVIVRMINPDGKDLGSCGSTGNRQLEPNNYWTVRVSGDCPKFDIAGTYTVVATVDSNNGVSESDETNNSKTITLSVTSSTGVGTTARTLGTSTSAAVQISGTVSYKIAENPTDLDKAVPTPYTTEPVILNYTFSNSTPGQKFIWVEFKDIAGKTDRTSAQIELLLPAVAVIEVDNPLNMPGIEKVVAKEFYKKYEDKYDFLGILFDFNRRQYYHTTVKNNVQGIGSQNWYLDGCNGTCGISKLDPNPIFDKTAEYGSKGKLLSIGVMGIISDYIGRNDDPSWIEEVIGHQFGVYVGSPHISSDPLHINSDESFGHWNNCMHFPRADVTQTYWRGNLWKDNGDGTWTRVDQDLNNFSKPLKFDPFMLYFMGFLPPEKVPNVVLLQPEGGFKSGLCFPGKTIKATPRQVSINDIIQKYGPRIPSYKDSQKEFSTAFILVVEKGKQPTPGALEKMAEWDKKFPEVIRQATSYTDIPTPTPTSKLSSVSAPTPKSSPSSIICTACRADINKSGGVDIGDYSFLVTCYNKKITDKNIQGKSCAPADINGDGKVNGSDFSCLASQFGKKC